MSYIVTGAAGFIGANIVKGLNARGITDILAVDNLEDSEKFKNLANVVISDYIDKRVFIELVKKTESLAQKLFFMKEHAQIQWRLTGTMSWRTIIVTPLNFLIGVRIRKFL